jgi:hypothetical protein
VVAFFHHDFFNPRVSSIGPNSKVRVNSFLSNEILVMSQKGAIGGQIWSSAFDGTEQRKMMRD